MKYNSYSEFSDAFFKENPELFDRTIVKKTVEISFDVGSHLSDSDVLEYLINRLNMNRNEYTLELKKC